MKSFALLTAGCVAVSIVPGVVHAQGYATAVAAGDGEVFVAEPLNELREGSVFVYRPSGGEWREVAQLRASDAIVGDHFGRALGWSGNTMISGATVVNETTGAAYVFTKDGSGTWRETARLQPAELSPGDAFGRVIAMTDDVAMISAWGYEGSRGGVFAYRRQPNGSWQRDGTLTASDAAENDWFGRSIAVEGDLAVIGASRKNENTGAAYVLRREGNQWVEEAKLDVAGLVPNSQFGSAVAIHDGLAFVGAPGNFQVPASVYVFAQDAETGEWSQDSRLAAFDAGPGSFFGTTITSDGNDVWVGASGVSTFTGGVYRFRRSADGEWIGSNKLAVSGLKMRGQFASTLSVAGDLAVGGATGDDYGMGTAVILARRGARWSTADKVWAEVEGLDPVVGGEVECTQGEASEFGCNDVDMVSFLPVASIGGGRGVRTNDVWGWTDPETGHEYALVGLTDATAFVDVTDAVNPQFLGTLPKTADAPGSSWRDIKVYNDHAFIVSDNASAHGMQVFDLTQLRDVRNAPVTFAETAHYDGIFSAHNMVINEETGYAFAVGSGGGGETCGGGLHMINIQDPSDPTFAGCFADPLTGQSGTGYSHDAQCVVYNGPDGDYRGKEICFGSNETALSIADVTDKDNPVAVSHASYPNVAYSHQGWLTDDHRYFYMNDEGDEISGLVEGTRTLIWDIEDIDDPILFGEYISENRSSDHNLYIRGNLMYQSNYVSGLRILDISDPANPVQVGYFDTVPWTEDAPGFDGSWSNYPFFESGTIIVTSGAEGLFMLRKRRPGVS
ncbi:MAG: choice-of-anchor B family protein [Gemmatimonadetes bacterium]|nr:choice-of-anchor B family protein [Gemmatimonadota bacterium]